MMHGRYLSLGSKSFPLYLIMSACHLLFFFQVEHYKGENEELVRKYEKTKEELEQAIEKLNEEVNVQRSETELHVSKLQRQNTLSEQKYMEEVILSNILFCVL